MTRSRRSTSAGDVLDRVRAADPWADSSLATLVPANIRAELREQIAAGPRAAARPAGRIVTHRTRIGLAAAIGAGVAASLVAVSLVGVGQPGTPAGPAVASASELLHQTADVARTAEDYTLTGRQRVYAGYLLDNGRTVASGEWWVRANGSYLARTKTYSGLAVQAFGIRVGESDLTRSVRPTTDNGEPKQWTYSQIRKVPTDRAGFAAWVRATAADTPVSRYAPPSVTDPDARALVVAVDLITQRLAPPALRGAGLDFVAGLPGAERLGSATDRIGRTGQLIGVPNRLDATVRDTLLVDPTRGTLLESTAGAAIVSEPANAGPDYNGPTGSATMPGYVRTYVGPTVVDRELVVPAGVSVAPR
jgi:hypothetical protein